jgi:outer membrane protein OmpA-like peptidoglycan-associated protein
VAGYCDCIGTVRYNLKLSERRSNALVKYLEKMPVASALALSAERRVKHLPVVDAEGELVGIVGCTEMMKALIATH